MLSTFCQMTLLCHLLFVASGVLFDATVRDFQSELSLNSSRLVIDQLTHPNRFFVDIMRASPSLRVTFHYFSRQNELIWLEYMQSDEYLLIEDVVFPSWIWTSLSTHWEPLAVLQRLRLYRGPFEMNSAEISFLPADLRHEICLQVKSNPTRCSSVFVAQHCMLWPSFHQTDESILMQSIAQTGSFVLPVLVALAQSNSAWTPLRLMRQIKDTSSILQTDQDMVYWRQLRKVLQWICNPLKAHRTWRTRRPPHLNPLYLIRTPANADEMENDWSASQEFESFAQGSPRNAEVGAMLSESPEAVEPSTFNTISSSPALMVLPEEISVSRVIPSLSEDSDLSGLYDEMSSFAEENRFRAAQTQQIRLPPLIPSYEVTTPFRAILSFGRPELNQIEQMVPAEPLAETALQSGSESPSSPSAPRHRNRGNVEIQEDSFFPVMPLSTMEASNSQDRTASSGSVAIPHEIDQEIATASSSSIPQLEGSSPNLSQEEFPIAATSPIVQRSSFSDNVSGPSSQIVRQDSPFPHLAVNNELMSQLLHDADAGHSQEISSRLTRVAFFEDFPGMSSVQRRQDPSEQTMQHLERDGLIQSVVEFVTLLFDLALQISSELNESHRAMWVIIAAIIAVMQGKNVCTSSNSSAQVAQRAVLFLLDSARVRLVPKFLLARFYDELIKVPNLVIRVKEESHQWIALHQWDVMIEQPLVFWPHSSLTLQKLRKSYDQSNGLWTPPIDQITRSDQILEVLASLLSHGLADSTMGHAVVVYLHDEDFAVPLATCHTVQCLLVACRQLLFHSAGRYFRQRSVGKFLAVKMEPIAGVFPAKSAGSKVFVVAAMLIHLGFLYLSVPLVDLSVNAWNAIAVISGQVVYTKETSSFLHVADAHLKVKSGCWWMAHFLDEHHLLQFVTREFIQSHAHVDINSCESYNT